MRELSQFWLQVKEKSRKKKVEIFWNLNIYKYILAIFKNLSWSKYGDFNFFFPRKMETLAHFSKNNALYNLQPLPFLSTSEEISPKKKKHLSLK